MINPDYLKTFQSLINTGSFTKTALQLYMTQPGVSQHIKKLEEHFGTELIKRSGKSFTITESGRRLLEYSQNLFLDYDKFKGFIKEDDPHSGVCKYASPGSFGLYVFDSLMETAKKYPKIKVSLQVTPNNSIPQLLTENRIDMAFMTRIPEEHNLQYEKYSEEELLLITPKGKKIKSFSDLVKLGAISHPDGPLFQSRLLSVNFPEYINQVNSIVINVFINQNNRILDPVAEGLGFAVLPEVNYKNYPFKEKLSICRLKTRVSDVIYQVQRRGEILPSRYQTIDNILRKKAKK